MISKFFIERPVLANVLAILMVVIGARRAVLAAGRAISRRHAADRAGARPAIRAPARAPSIDTVALPIEQQVNGVEDMIYMQSTSTSDGTYTLHRSRSRSAPTSTSRRCWCRTASRPRSRRCRDAVQKQGVNVQKQSTAILSFVTLTSPDKTFDSLYLANYAHDPPEGRTRAAARASATCRSSAPASIRCASGSIRKSCKARGLTAAGRHRRRCSSRASRSRPARSARRRRRPASRSSTR